MPMGIVSDEEFAAELKDSAQVLVPEILPLEKPGRKLGDVNVPNFLREVIGETAAIDGRQDALALAEQWGISPSSVSAYRNGATSTATMNKQPNLEKINRARKAISAQARNKIKLALRHITAEKLEETKPVELASIARSLAGVVKDMEPEDPKDPNGGKDKPQFVVFAPSFKSENHYEAVQGRDTN